VDSRRRGRTGHAARMRAMRNTKLQSVNLKERDNSEDLVIDGI
jgi:hypothetical protein